MRDFVLFCPILFFLSAPVLSLVRAFTSSSIKSNVLLLGLAIVVCTTSGRVSSRHFRYGREFCSGVCSCLTTGCASSVISALIHVRTSLRPLEFETVDMGGTRPLWWPRRLSNPARGSISWPLFTWSGSLLSALVVHYVFSCHFLFHRSAAGSLWRRAIWRVGKRKDSDSWSAEKSHATNEAPMFPGKSPCPQGKAGQGRMKGRRSTCFLSRLLVS